nr:N-acetylmuramidase domain-containing protein [Pseudomonas sp. S11A4]
MPNASACRWPAYTQINEVESGAGFLDGGKPVILFERHIVSPTGEGSPRGDDPPRSNAAR